VKCLDFTTKWTATEEAAAPPNFVNCHMGGSRSVRRKIVPAAANKFKKRTAP